MQHFSIATPPFEDIQNSQSALISCGTCASVRIPTLDNLPADLDSQTLPSNATLAAQISSTVNLSTRFSSFTGTPTRAPSNVHHQTSTSQFFVGFQPQRRSLANVPPSWHFQDSNISGQNSSHIFPFARGTPPQILSSQADANFLSQPVHSGRSISISPAVHQGATLQPQAQVAYSAAPYSLLPPSDSILSLAFSSLRVTSSDAHYVHQPLGCHNQLPQPPLVRVPFPLVLHRNPVHSFVKQNFPTSQAQLARFESSHHGQLHPYSNRFAAYDPQGASFTHSHLPSTFAGALHPMPRSITSGSFPMFQNPNMPFHADWSSTLQVHSRNVRYASPHPAIQPLEAKLRGTTGETA